MFHVKQIFNLKKTKMKQETPMKQILNLIPDASQIKEFISNNDADEKMLDEWLWEKIFKGNDWLEKEKQAIIDSVNNTIDAYSYYTESPHNQPPMNGQDYFNNKYNTK